MSIGGTRHGRHSSTPTDRHSRSASAHMSTWTRKPTSGPSSDGLWKRPDLPAITEMHNILPFTTAKSSRLLEALRALDDYVAPGPGKPKGKFKRPRDWYLNALRDHARAIRREPTEQEFCDRYRIDRKTLRRNLGPHGYGLWPWEEFLHRGLHSSRARIIKI
jgi:hypothetical protein